MENLGGEMLATHSCISSRRRVSSQAGIPGSRRKRLAGPWYGGATNVQRTKYTRNKQIQDEGSIPVSIYSCDLFHLETV